MSAFPPIVPPLVATTASAVACAALLAVRRTRRELAAIRRELADHRERVDGAAARAAEAVRRLPAARSAERDERDEEIRAAVAAALAEERERELAEARAFWAAHEAREAAGTPAHEGGRADEDARFPGGPGGPESADDADGPGDAAYLDLPAFDVLPPVPPLPRQTDRLTGDGARPGRRRHPSDPDFAPSPVVADPEQTIARLGELAEARTPLADVRPGPLGTLDLYVFTDGTTLCLTPGHSETADRLTDALERGETPVLLGGSGISGAYALTFTFGDESVFVLADRVVASL